MTGVDDIATPTTPTAGHGPVLTDRLGGRWSVWITGGGMPGCWMSDWNYNRPVWSGTHAEACEYAGERQRVHGRRGLNYEVRKAPSDTEAYYGHPAVQMLALGCE